MPLPARKAFFKRERGVEMFSYTVQLCILRTFIRTIVFQFSVCQSNFGFKKMKTGAWHTL